MQKRTDQTPVEKLEEELPSLCHNFLRAAFVNKSTLTRLNYAKDIKYFLEYAVYHYAYFQTEDIKGITIEELSQITPLDIDRYLTYMKDQDYSQKTMSRRKSSISSLFRYLVYTEQVLKTNPIQGSQPIKVEKSSKVKYLNREEQEKLLNTIIYGTGLPQKALDNHERYYKRDLAIVYLFLDTGLRISELQGLDIKDVDLKKCELSTLRKGKGEESDFIFFSDTACEYIKDYLNERRVIDPTTSAGDPLFISNRKTRISIRNIEAMLTKYVKAAFNGEKNFISPHKLRSSFAMEFYRAQDGDILLLQNRMGHTSIVSTNIYAKAFEKEKIRETRNWRDE